MKKIVYLAAILLSMVVLNACTSPTEYVITATNAESFYEIDYQFKYEDETFEVRVELEPKFEFDQQDVEIELRIYLKIYEIDLIRILEFDRVYKAEAENVLRVREIMEEDIMLIEFHDITIHNATGTIQSGNEIEVTEKTYQTYASEPTPLTLNIDNPIENEEIYDEVEQKLSLFNANGNQMDIDLYTYVRVDDGNGAYDFTLDQQILVQESPYYIDIILGDVHQIFTTVNDYLMFIMLSPESYDDGVYYYTPIEINNDELENLVPNLDQDFDSDIMRFTRLNNRVYHFISKASDLLTESDLYGIYDMNETTEFLDQAFIQGQIEFFNDQVIISYGFKHNIDDIELQMMIQMTFRKGMFTPIDFENSDQYVMKMPTTIEDAFLTSPIDVELKGIMDGSGIYYKFEMEPGTYVITSSQNDFGGMQFTTFNSSYHEVYLGILDSQTSEYSLGISHQYLLIEEEGTYYIKAAYAIYGLPFDFKVSRIESSNTNPNQGQSISENGTYSFELINAFDLHTFFFETDEITALKITGTNIPSFIEKTYLYSNFYRYDDIDDSQYIIIGPEQSYLIFFNDSLTQPKEYEIEFELISNQHTSSMNIAEMEELTDTFHPNPVITGPDIPVSYMKLVVTEEARYQFVFDQHYNYLSGELLIEENAYPKDFYNQSYIDLMPGTYILKFSDNHGAIASIRYEKIDLDIEIIHHELSTVDSPDTYASPLPRLVGEIDHGLHRVYYEFTLLEESMVMFDMNHSLYNEQHQKISFNKLPYRQAILYELPAGTYKVLVNVDTLYFPRSYSIILAKVEGEFADDSQFKTNIENAFLNITYSLTSDYRGDRDVMKFVVTNRSEYIFSTNMQIYMTNQDFNYMDTIYENSNGYAITLNPGTYYLTNHPSMDETWTFRITT